MVHTIVPYFIVIIVRSNQDVKNAHIRQLFWGCYISMTQKSLSNLCAYQIYYDRQFDLEETVDLYSKLHAD